MKIKDNIEGFESSIECLKDSDVSFGLIQERDLL